MIPGDRFSSTYIAGALDNPIPLNRLAGSIWGPADINDPTQGFYVQRWDFSSDGFSVFLESPTYPKTLLFTIATRIYNVSLSFDTNANPCVAFQEPGRSLLYWFDPVPNSYVFFEFAVDATYPYITLDEGRTFNQTNADNILGYIRDGAVRYRQLRDRYTIEYTPTIGPLGPAVAADILYYVGMNASLRLEFVYGDLPTFYDAPDIMKKQILIQKAPAEVLDVTFNFYHTMMFNDVIVGATVVITLETGTDAAPAAMLDGSTTHTDREVTQSVKGGITGNVYRISMSALTANSCIYVVEGLLAINDSPATVPVPPP